MADDLQVENGNFTRIVNPLIEQLIQLPFKGCELAVALFIIRKTYGFQKKQDEISLTQFQLGLKRSRQTIVTALKNLQLVKVARLVKRGSMKGDGNIWAINKYHATWELGKMARLVQRKRGASLTEAPNLVKTARHTKETKEKTKETSGEAAGKGRLKHNPLGAEVIKAFIEFNPACAKFYDNNTQRGACDRLIESYGLEEVRKRVSFLPQSNKIPYFPSITTPYALEQKWVQLQDKVEQYKAKRKEKVQEII